MSFGENLKALRISHKLSQKDLADELGFSFQNISKWERNESQPDIDTLFKIANYFSTTTDALWGLSYKEKMTTLRISTGDIDIYDSYPKDETHLKNKLVFVVDDEAKIAAIIFVAPMRIFKHGYLRAGYEPFDEHSSIHYILNYRFRGKDVVDNLKIKIPTKGFLFSISDKIYEAKLIMNFIIPDEYSSFLDPDTHCGYYNSRNGNSLFDDVLKNNELDNVTVELKGEGIIFKKPTESLDTSSIDIETVTKIVRKDLKKEYDKQINKLWNRIDELENLLDDCETSIENLEAALNRVSGS